MLPVRPRSGRRKELYELNFLCKRFAQFCDDLGCQDRMAAEFKEVVVYADLVEVQHFAPDLRDQFFDSVRGSTNP